MTDNYTKLVDRYPVRKSIDKVNEAVGAPAEGWIQDPELELAKPDYIPRLLSLYTSESLDNDDKFYLISFLFACFEDAVYRGIKIEDDWGRAAILISNNIDLHAATLAYWSCYEADDPNDPEEMFVISQQVREIWDVHREKFL